MTATNPLVVPDASVILKWVLSAQDEPYSRQAISLRDQFLEAEVDFLVPSLWIFEAGNTLARKCPGEVLEQMRDLRDLGMRESAMSSAWLEHACKLAGRYKVAFYDAAYHAAAIVHNGMLITADEAYLRKVGDEDHVCHLADWK